MKKHKFILLTRYVITSFMFILFLCIAMTCGKNDVHDNLVQSFVIWSHDSSYYIFNFKFFKLDFIVIKLKKLKRIYNESEIVYALYFLQYL